MFMIISPEYPRNLESYILEVSTFNRILEIRLLLFHSLHLIPNVSLQLKR
jgi:hypothetical protein